jgi:HCOMODA/2-hydroxy-3-carboxy-muconic semialdehyde decarboxylase
LLSTIESLRDVVIANRILAHEGVVDAYGHVSMRHPDDPERYLLSRSRSPELVTLDDVLEFRLDGEVIDGRGFSFYAERYIHGAIYEARPDVMAVVHNHSNEVIPFTISKEPLRPVLHVAAAMGGHAPVWDIRDHFGDTDLLVVNMEHGRDLAQGLGDNTVVLMRGHGCAVVGDSIRAAVLTSIHLQTNAKVLAIARGFGDVTYMSPGEIERMTATSLGKLSVDRAWEYYRRRAGMGDG